MLVADGKEQFVSFNTVCFVMLSAFVLYGFFNIGQSETHVDSKVDELLVGFLDERLALYASQLVSHALQEFGVQPIKVVLVHQPV